MFKNYLLLRLKNLRLPERRIGLRLNILRITGRRIDLRLNILRPTGLCAGLCLRLNILRITGRRIDLRLDILCLRLLCTILDINLSGLNLRNFLLKAPRVFLRRTTLNGRLFFGINNFLPRERISFTGRFTVRFFTVTFFLTGAGLIGYLGLIRVCAKR